MFILKHRSVTQVIIVLYCRSVNVNHYSESMDYWHLGCSNIPTQSADIIQNSQIGMLCLYYGLMLTVFMPFLYPNFTRKGFCTSCGPVVALMAAAAVYHAGVFNSWPACPRSTAALSCSWMLCEMETGNIWKNSDIQPSSPRGQQELQFRVNGRKNKRTGWLDPC